MTRYTLPSGPVWEAAKAEKNWFAYAIVPQPGRKPLKQPANVKTGWAPEAADKVAIFDFPNAASGINDLNRRLPEINRRRTTRSNKAEDENEMLKDAGKRPKPNYFKCKIDRFVPGYLPRVSAPSRQRAFGLPPQELCACGSWDAFVIWMGICDVHWCEDRGRQWSFREPDVPADRSDPSVLPPSQKPFWRGALFTLPATAS